MKYFFTLLLSLFLGLHLNAQLTPGSIAPNFALSDIDGNLHVLHDYLDQEKSVVLFVFAVHDFNSWALAGDLNELNAQYGPNGTDEAIFLALETDPMTNDDLTNNNSVGVPGSNPTDESWEERIEFPIINQTGAFEVDFETESSYPYFMVVYPNRITNPASISDAQDEIQSLLQEAGDNTMLPGGTNNVATVSYLGADIVCGSVAPAFSFQNLGLANLSFFEATLEYNGEEVETKPWTGNLATFETAVIGFGLVDVTVPGTFTLTLSNPNGVTDDDLDGNILITTIETATNIGASSLTVTLTPDSTPEQTSWSILSSSGAIIASNDNLSAGETVMTDVEFEEDDCYTFIINDAGNDGLNSAIGDLVISFDGQVIYQGTNYGSQLEVPFKVQLETFVQIDVATPVVNADGTVDFSASSPENIVSWVWNFGGNVTENGAEVSNYYNQNDTYSYAVTATTNGGVTETINGTFMVALPPQAAFAITQTPGENNNITVQDLSSYTGALSWDFGGLGSSTEDPANFSFTFNDTYTVCLTVTNEQGTDTACEEVVVTDGIVGVETLNQNTWSVYPNPVQDQLFIETQENINQINIFDATGKQLKNSFNANSINLVDLPNGLYLIKIETENGIGIQSFVKF